MADDFVTRSSSIAKAKKMLKNARAIVAAVEGKHDPSDNRRAFCASFGIRMMMHSKSRTQPNARSGRKMQ